MSDTPQGPGWWQASDGKWYAPAGATPPPPPPPSGSPFGVPPPPGAPQQPVGGYAGPSYPAPSGAGRYASWGLRVGAYLLDILLLAPVWIIGAILLQTDAAALGVIFYVLAFAGSLYFAYLTGASGASPGKRLMGIKVVNERTGQPMGGGLGIARVFIHIIDSLPCYLGYLWPLWDAKRQTFTDKVLGTVVYDGQPKQQFGGDLFKP